jgi:predicted TIM-barrel enzyme
VAVLADVFVKHAVPPPGVDLGRAAADMWERAGADALVVTGAGTGHPASLDDLEQVKAAAHGAPLFVGSGVTPQTVGDFLRLADGVIVGTSLKRNGVTQAPVDPARARALVAAARH